MEDNRSRRNRKRTGRGFKKLPPVFMPYMTVKIGVTFGCVLILLVILVFVLIGIKNEKGDEYTVRVLSQQNYSSSTIPFKRGDILDRNGITLATSIKFYNIILDPKVIYSKDEYLEPTVKSLVECFEYDEEDLRKKIKDNENSSYVVYQKELTYDQIEKFIKRQNNTKQYPNIKGVWFETEYKRKYPYSSLGCHVIGFTTTGNVGRWGIEEYYDEVLDGVDGRQYGYVNGDNIMEKNTKEATNGNSVVSTIDFNLQGIVEKNIAKWKEEYKPENIGVILMNPQNGEIYAMASDVTYDLNDPNNLDAYYSKKKQKKLTDEQVTKKLSEIWRNYCLSDTFEPGSTFKPFTVAAALEEATIGENTTFICDGSESVGGYNIHCHNRAGHGKISVSQAIAYSCNDALMQIAAGIGTDLFVEYQDRFNFGRKTGIDLPGEASCAGLLFTKENILPVNLATSSFGQSFNVTMVQLAVGFSSLINGGYYYQPHMVKAIVNEKGGIVEEIGKTVVKQTITQDTCDIVKKGLIETVTGGTGQNSSIKGCVVGGKTGTAEKLPRGSDEYVLSFIGFVGEENPELVCYVVVDNAAENNQNSAITTSLFNTIVKEALPYLNIFPEDKATDNKNDGASDGTSDNDGAADGDLNNNTDTTDEPAVPVVPEGVPSASDL